MQDKDKSGGKKINSLTAIFFKQKDIPIKINTDKIKAYVCFKMWIL